MKKNIAIYLDFLPHPASCDVGADGYAVAKRQVNSFNKNDIAVILAALKLAKELDAETTIYSVGKNQPKDLVARALAIGVDNSVHIGSFSWQGEIPVAAKAKAFCEYAATFDLLLTANTSFAVMVSENLQLPVATSVSKLDLTPNGVTVTRKLQRGKRQQVELVLPTVLELIDTSELLPLPSVQDLMAARAKEQPVIRVDYADLYRTMASTLAEEPNFQPMPLAPAGKIIWQPNSDLSAGQRLAQLAEGAVQARHGRQIAGNPKECAEHIVNYMLGEGLIAKKN